MSKPQPGPQRSELEAIRDANANIPQRDNYADDPNVREPFEDDRDAKAVLAVALEQLPTPSLDGDVSTEHVFLEPLSVTDWPVLEPVALHGLAGDIVNTLDESTEADKSAVLFNVLAMFGTFVGPKPRMIVDGAIHTARIFVVVVGNTARARKSTATAQTRRLFARC